ncbi:hypothetical protein LR48_Vigan08g044200 [Vigna angularis]|uniref:Myb/SANT-like domain-containing protein n=1 Tax=Phaseolus angularis TaxID=3914 RepID=A0A0L9V3G9_PHAAN|nr:hypothetical protein LR48_Vigan08g044200 [Vigna angularis]
MVMKKNAVLNRQRRTSLMMKKESEMGFVFGYKECNRLQLFKVLHALLEDGEDGDEGDFKMDEGLFVGGHVVVVAMDDCKSKYMLMEMEREVERRRKTFLCTAKAKYKMNRGKAAYVQSSAPTREFIKWTEDMDARLLQSMIEESRIGNRVDGSWTSQAYSNMVDHLHSCGYVAITKNNVKNRQKVLKDKWREVHDLFSGLSGFAWNPVSMTFHAEDKVWMDLIQLWAADRATGSGVRTAREARRQRVAPRFSVDLNQNIEYIPEQPEWAGYRDPTPPSPPPSVDEYSPGQTQSVPSVPSAGTSSSRGSKRKAPMVDVIDSQFDKLTTSLDGFANVLSSSNVHFGVISDAAVRQVSAMEDRNKILRRNPNYTYTETDIYEMLNSMNIAYENLLDQCYDFLCGNPTCTRRLMGLPPHKRWNKLCKMISDGDC